MTEFFLNIFFLLQTRLQELFYALLKDVLQQFLYSILMLAGLNHQTT